MRIAVLSDTHDRLPDHVVANVQEADEIWHLGDVIAPVIVDRLRDLGRPLRVVRGNCDECPDWPHALEFALCGVRFVLLHVPPRVPPPEIDVLLHGHTHVPRDEIVQGVRMLNPGCITRPNRGAPSSYAWLHVEDGALVSWEIVPV